MKVVISPFVNGKASQPPQTNVGAGLLPRMLQASTLARYRSERSSPSFLARQKPFRCTDAIRHSSSADVCSADCDFIVMPYRSSVNSRDAYLPAS